MGVRQSWVRKMLNAANLGWVATYSLRKEKGAKKEVGAGARPPAQRLGSGRICGPGGHRPGASAHSRSPAAVTTASPASALDQRPPGLRRARPGGRATEEQRTASRPRPAPLRPTGPCSHSLLAGKTVRRGGRSSAPVGPDRLATGSSARDLRVPPRHVAVPAPSRHRPYELSEKRLIPMKPKHQESNNFSLRAAAGCCACEVSLRFSGSRPLTSPPPLGVLGALHGRARRGVRRGPAGVPRIPALARTAGGWEGSSAGGFKNTEPLIGL